MFAIQDILTAAIVFVPVIYGAVLAAQFVSGLGKLGNRTSAPATAPVVPTATAAHVEQIPDEVEETGYCPAVVAPIAASVAPVVAADWAEYSTEDHRLVEDAWVSHYCREGLSDVVVPFRRVRGTQKPQQQHPAIEGMSLRKMRELGAQLRIKNARRWNTAQAKEALHHYYSSAA